MSLKGKTVLITGGSRGIGRACAQEFAAQGCTVAVNYLRDENAASETLSSLSNGNHFAIKTDVTDPAAIESMIKAVVDRTGSLDVLVNNVGMFEDDDIDSRTYEEWLDIWQRTMSTVLMSAANTSYCAFQQMKKQGGGRIVNVTSRGPFRGDPDALAYAAAKSGLHALSKSLALKAAPFGIFVTDVAPGFVDTDMAAPYLDSPEKRELLEQQSPIGKIATPHDVARAVVFVASDETGMTTGTTIDINGASYLRP